ncbi:hypothetical protein H4O16_34670 (plasmid) [Bacillus thuringiensis]|uniref:hypothetical protein n=1 Tax=Bacillus thuringiensis TaxID=1428 RepID=UPI00399ABBE0
MEMPKISLTYNLADVANGLTNWLGAYWPIIAFSVAIPLTFLVAFNTKRFIYSLIIKNHSLIARS